MSRRLSILCGLFLLAACKSTSPVEHPPLTFQQYQPINMAVSNIKVVQEYQPPLTPPHVEHLVPYSPSEAVEIWVKDRLRAVGSDKSLQVIVKDGSIVEADLPKKGGMTGFFTNDQDKRYDAKLVIEMRVYGEGALSLSSIEVTATRSLTVPENTSTFQRDAIFRKMVFDLMDIANAQLEKNMFMYMSNYISYSQNP